MIFFQIRALAELENATISLETTLGNGTVIVSISEQCSADTVQNPHNITYFVPSNAPTTFNITVQIGKTHIYLFLLLLVIGVSQWIYSEPTVDLQTVNHLKSAY